MIPTSITHRLFSILILISYLFDNKATVIPTKKKIELIQKIKEVNTFLYIYETDLTTVLLYKYMLFPFDNAFHSFFFNPEETYLIALIICMVKCM